MAMCQKSGSTQHNTGAAICPSLSNRNYNTTNIRNAAGASAAKHAPQPKDNGGCAILAFVLGAALLLIAAGAVGAGHHIVSALIR